MIPLRISVEGFMSYRDQTELVFEGAPLWVLAGRNGSGKSAIFDAITFALYGVHRGGAQNAKALINHSAKSLAVEFDFAVGDDTFRVKRTVGRKGATTVQAFRLDGAEPVPVAETETKAGFDTWVLGAIGLDSRTFTASVLLQQGRSEALLDADPKARHEMLGQIIDLSAYERLYDRAEERHKEHRAMAESCRLQLGGLDPVDEAELGGVAAAAEEAGREADLARGRVERMLGLKAEARRWEELAAERGRLERMIADATELVANAGEIERNAARLAELARVLPALGRLVDVERELAAFPEDLDRAVERARAEVEALDEIKTALPWLQMASRARSSARAAEERARAAEDEARALEASVGEARTAAETAAGDLDAAARAAEDADRRKTEAATLRGEAQLRLARFEEVDGTAACTYCGQPLTAEHLEKERVRLENELTARETSARDAERVAASAIARREKLADASKRAAREAADVAKRHEKTVRDAETARAEIARETAQFSEAAGHLPAIYAERRSEETFPSAEDVGEAERQSREFDARRGELEKLGGQVRARDRVVDKHTNAREEIGRLAAESGEARLAAEGFTAERLDALRTEEAGLAGADERRARLDEARRAGRDLEERLRDAERDAERVPEEARRPVAEIDANETEAREAFEAADTRRREAEALRHELQSRREQRGDLERRSLDATRQENLYRELAKLLGRDRLQRHLLQQAETAIVALANEVLDRLSTGALWLELKREAEGEGRGTPKALDLVAFNNETGGDAIPVAFLSGSQRFRVAVSLALAIGRYAGQGGRRIESVIIDEGFGSLDREGRREMIDELHALKSALDRIILVSHQEEFAGAFANKYFVELVDGSSRARLVEES